MAAEVNVDLRVLEIAHDDVYRDIVRVPEAFRKTARGTIPEGCICRVTCGSRSAYLIVRGSAKRDETAVWMDERTRSRLHVVAGNKCRLELRKAGPWGGLCWALRASDMSYRIMAILGLVSVGLGLIGLVLGVLGFTGCGG